MTLTQRLCATAACLCVGMLAVAPSMSLAGDQGVIAAKKKPKKCKKGYVRKGSKCVKKKPAKKKPATLTVPADGDYSGADGLTLTVAKRTVSVRARIPLTCPSGPGATVGFLVRTMPLTGTTFTGTSSPDPEFGQTTMSGKFTTAKTLHLTAQVMDYKNGSDTCTGQLDVTTALHASR